mgnify:CR=1 FL=1
MQIPERGFYYHYKHEDARGFTHHAYEVLGLSRHTEDETFLVRYRPLYSERTYLGDADQSVRPLDLWFTQVEWNGETLPRFTRVTDPVLLEKLIAVRTQTYGA